MYRNLIVIFLLVVALTGQAQSPSIGYASSSYKSSAGAIGPSGIISTTVYDIKINSSKSILLDSALINGFKVFGEGIIIPTNKLGTIAFSITIATHQQEKLWYSGALGFQDMAVGVNVYNNSNFTHKVDPAIILFVRTGKGKYKIIKEKFDQTHSQYNK